MAFKNGKSCLFGCGTAMLIFPLFAAVIFLVATLLWGLNLRDFEREYEEVSLFMVALSACAGLGAGMIVYALTRKKPER
jgi:hypothetical protein